MSQRTKVCTQCEEDKPLVEYYKTAKGLHLHCKSCCALNNRVYRVKQRELRRGYARKYYLKKNPNASTRRKNPKALGPQTKTTIRHARRADKLGLPSDPTISLTEAYKRAKGVCAICNKDVKPGEASLDHVIPMSKGGPHLWENIQMTHLKCNCSKGAKL